MASLIANEFSEASGDLHLAALMAVGFTLFVITLIVNAIARWLVWQVSRSAGGNADDGTRVRVDPGHRRTALWQRVVRRAGPIRTSRSRCGASSAGVTS